MAAALPAAPQLAHFRKLSAAGSKQVKITGIRAMNLGKRGTSLLKIETDAGLVGYGEASASGPMLRARIEEMMPLLEGQDPLAIERHFHAMTTMMHPHLPHIPSVGGIDIALWDLAGKILDRPVYQLLGGPFRKTIPMYSHGGPRDMLDRAQWKDWVDRATAQPEGFTIYKKSPPFPGSASDVPLNLTGGEINRIVRGFSIGREVCEGKVEIAVHCHNELDTPSAILLAKGLEPVAPPFLEDPVGVPFSESWTALRRASSVPLLVGEKLELVSGFRPFVDNAAADILHPDLVYAGGITGTMRIAHYAALSRIPVALHNVGHLVNTLAAGHFGCAVQNFYRSESRLGEGNRPVEAQAASNGPVVREGRLRVSEEPGLGVHWNEEYLREHLAPNEPWWG